MVAAASAFRVPLFLGERGGDAVVAEVEQEVEDVRFGNDGPGPRGLTTLAAAIESGRMGVVEEGDLGAELRSRLALKTLRRRAEKRGRTPVLRCSSRGLQALAKSAGWQTEFVSGAAPSAGPGTLRSPGPLATLAGPRPAQRGTTSPEPPPAPTTRVAGALGERGVRRVGRWMIGVLPVALVIGTLLFPHASITVVPVAETTVIELPITVNPAAKKADSATGTLPGRAITRELSDTLTAPATGRRTVPDAKATGEVVLLNRSASSVAVPKGTILLAGPVKFSTQSDVTVAPSRRAGNAPIFGMASVRVQAVTGGPSGNVERSRIDRIEGALAASLTVQNNQPTRGGTERAATFVTEDDRRKLQEQLHRSLAERLSQEVKKDLPVSDKESLIAWSGQNPAVVETAFSKNADEEAPTVTLTLKLRYGATAFANDAYNELAREIVARGAIPSKPGYRVSPASVQPEAPSLAGAESGVVRLVGRVRATVIADVDAAKLRTDLAGKPIADAHSYLTELPGIASHEVRTVNFLPGKLPLIGWRIGVSARAPG